MSSVANRFKQLSGRDLELVLKLSERIHYTNSNEPYLNHLFVVFNEALPSKFLSVESYSVSPIAFEQAVNVGVTDEMDAICRMYLYQHPVLKYFMGHAGTSSVGRILALTSAAEFHKTDLYQKFYRVLGIEDQLIFMVPHPHGIYVVAYSRDTAFSKKEQMIIELLKPQVQISLRNWQRIREFERHQRTLEEKSVVTNSGAYEEALVDRLSPRQRAIAEHVAQGFENRQIGERLYISPKTVGKHLENIFTILDIHNRAALAAFWQRHQKEFVM